MKKFNDKGFYKCLLETSDGDSKQSVFENPAWVTANLTSDTMDCLADKLTEGKDYKVIEVSDNTFLIEDDLGRVTTYNKSWFDNPKEIYAQKQTSVEEDGDSFDGLVYVEPKEDAYISIANLTEEQKLFLDMNLKWYDVDRLTDPRKQHFTVLNFCKGSSWFTFTHTLTGEYKEVFFNDIFVKEG